MWVEMAQDGSLSAFGNLARRYRPGLVALCSQFVTREDAEDIAQESLLVAYRALPGLEDASRFRAWLGTIARNLALRKRRQNVASVPVDDLILAYVPEIVHQLAMNSEAASIRCKIAELPPEIKASMELYYVHEWTVSAVAEFLTLPTTTIKWRLHTGRRLVRQRFGADIEDSYNEK